MGAGADDESSRSSPQYMGCVEVLQSMRALDFNTRTQVTRLVGSGAECGTPGASEGRWGAGPLLMGLVMVYLWVVKGMERKLGE